MLVHFKNSENAQFKFNIIAIFWEAIFWEVENISLISITMKASNL